MIRLHFSLKKATILVATGLLVLLVAVYFTSHTVPGILETRYKQQITDAYQEAFPPLDSYFNQMGVVFQSADASSCPYGPYDAYSQCRKSRFSNDIVFDASKEAQWLGAGRRLDTHLSNNGWLYGSENGTKASTFAGVFSHTGSSQVIVEYSKEINGVTCTVSASYVAGGHPSTEVDETCAKYSERPY